MISLRAVALLVVATAIVLVLAVRPSIEIEIPPSRIVSAGGHAYLFRMPDPGRPGYFLPSDNLTVPFGSKLVLMEDDKPLGPPHFAHEFIREKGTGGFSHWGTDFVFSSSDNTAPGQNGRVYKAVATLSLVPALHWTAITILVAIALAPLAFARARIAIWLASQYWATRKDPRSAVIAAAKVLALAGMFAISLQPFLTHRTGASWAASAVQFTSSQRDGWTWVEIVQAIIALACIMGICVAPFLRDWRIRVPLVAVVVLAFLVDAIVLNTSGQSIAFDMADTLWRERAVGASILGSYLVRILGAMAIFAILLTVLVWRPSMRWSLARKFAVVPLVAFLAGLGLIYYSKGAMTAFPPGLSVPAQFAFVNLVSASGSENRHPVDYPGKPRPLFKKIVFIVDESVRGDYISLNNPKLDNTPALTAALPFMANFGVATSGANCSAAARLFLRIGLQPKELPDVDQVWTRKTTMWDFARFAGFKTVLIDGHSPPAPMFHSYMSVHEARSIDSIKTESVTPWYNRDHAIPATLLELLQSPEPMFIAVNKFGAHTNYEDVMPPGFTYATKRDDSGSKLDPPRRSIVTSYDRALRWSVDGFFERILPQAIRDDVLIIYTSDHGQALFDGGYDTQHCALGSRIADGESYVPLFAITGSKPYLADLQREAVRSFNRASHFEIFPTLLSAMGYDPRWSAQRYGPDMFNVPHDRKRGFLVGGFFSATAKWQMLGANTELGPN